MYIIVIAVSRSLILHSNCPIHLMPDPDLTHYAPITIMTPDQ